MNAAWPTVLKFLRWSLVPLLLLDALLINSFVRYGPPVESVPVEVQRPLKPGEVVFQVRQIPPSKQDWIIAATLLMFHFLVLWAFWARRKDGPFRDPDARKRS